MSTRCADWTWEKLEAANVDASTYVFNTERGPKSSPSINVENVMVIVHTKLVTVDFFIATHKRLTIPPRLYLIEPRLRSTHNEKGGWGG